MNATLRRSLTPLASLRLTVALLAAAMVLIFAGTLAQTQFGVWKVVDTYFRSPVAFIDPALFLPGADHDSPSAFLVPFPGGLTIAALMIVNLLAAHSLRFKASRKRLGIIVLHLGLIVLLAGEFVTGFFADEGLMRIDEGGSSSVVEDMRTFELAVLDPSDPDHDRVVTVPGALVLDALNSGEPVADPRLPFRVYVDAFHHNADLVQAVGNTPATHGFGLQVAAQRRPQARGVDLDDQTDAPAAYVTLATSDRTLGTYLLSTQFIAHQPVSLDDQTFGVALRFQRTYLPFSLHLHDFRHDTFTGTNIARNFSSDLHLTDPRDDTDRDVRIWMNNPLRYDGKTFYQASYKPDGTGTVLQVVDNPGWLLPYVACILVGSGMTYHFALSLTTFLGKRRRGERNAAPANAPTTDAAGPNRPGLLRAIALALALLVALSGLVRNPAPDAPGLNDFAHLPVSAGGRVKPIDTAARNLLMVTAGRQTAEADDPELPELDAAAFYLNLVAKAESIAPYDVVRVDHPDLLAILDRAPEQGGRISLLDIEPHFQEITRQAHLADAVAPRERSAFHIAALELFNRVQQLRAHAQLVEPFTVPPLGLADDWRPFPQAMAEHPPSSPHPAVAHITAIMSAAHDGDAETFATASASYRALLERDEPGLMRRMRVEVLFNRASPFAGATAVYVLASLALAASFLLRARAAADSPWPERLRSSAVAFVVAALIVHTLAIAVRIYLQDRPPVTNLYSSAVFVGWASVLAGLFLERLYPLGVAAFAAASVGASTLIVAHNLGADGDTMQMMQAVLDSNFWLATHVITITLGYSAVFLAGALGAVYLVARCCTRALDRDRALALSRMTYGVVCFALLLSFVGTVLGGIWADQSWGRFWGWDPKENGAALVVLITAIILHARWAGLIKQRGVAVLAVAGNIVTAWSWFGTNMLGVGLHSYGFMDSAAFYLAAFVASQLLIMALALAPPRSTKPNRPANAASADAESTAA